jgi:UDP-GlcNAc:undecaprenyl-phosphate GlcNAc-1-phosphate transferase
MDEITLLIVGVLLGLGIAALICVNAAGIGKTLGLLDHPDGGRKRHARPTPLVGGIAVAVSTAAGAALAFSHSADLHLVWLALAVAMMFGIGMIDDRRHLPPLLRIGVALLILGSVMTVAPEFQVYTLQFAGQPNGINLGGALGLGFTLPCLVGLLNAVNMADGKNGIVTGLGLVWTGVLWFHAPPALLPLLATVFAALAVIWSFNMAGKLFLGDGGSYALSALFGLLAIFVYNGRGASLFAGDVAVLFGVPVFDTIRLMVARASAGRSPFHPDRDHLHHHLYARIGWPLGLWVYLAMVALPNFAALVWPGTGVFWLLASFIVYAFLMVMIRFSPAGRPAE